MDYGRTLVNWQNKIEGRPFARGGTGCMCGVAGIGAAGFARAVLWRYQNSPLPSVVAVALAASSKVVGKLPGYEDNNSIVIAQSLVPGSNGGQQLAAISSYAQVWMLTTLDGAPLSAGEAIFDAEVQSAEVEDMLTSMEDGVTGVLEIKGVDADAASRRARWYENTLNDFVGRLTYISEHQLLRLSIDLEIIKAAPDISNFEKRLQALKAIVARNARRAESLKLTMREWVVEAYVQAQKAANQGLLGRIQANFARIGGVLDSLLGAMVRLGSAVKKAAEGLEEVVDDSKAAAGAAGVIAVGVIGLIAVLMLSGGRKK